MRRKLRRVYGGTYTLASVLLFRLLPKQDLILVPILLLYHINNLRRRRSFLGRRDL